jgi:enamine deaminase RidA (YjgF/YER057c/UK114 family)
MKTLVVILLVLFFIPVIINAQNEKTGPEERLKQLNIHLITPTAPVANYVKAVRVGNLIYLSGHGPDKPEGGLVTGKVGSDLTLEQAQAAARLVGISLLSTLKAQIGNLDKVKRIVKVLGMVNAIPTFEKQPQVINGFSDFMVEVFGENGKHARSAVGVASLPSNIPVEIEMIVELKVDKRR